LRLLVAILCFITSSYSLSRSYNTTRGRNFTTSASIATVLADMGATYEPLP
jgi:hypothetical protein